MGEKVVPVNRMSLCRFTLRKLLMTKLFPVSLGFLKTSGSCGPSVYVQLQAGQRSHGYFEQLDANFLQLAVIMTLQC